MPSSNVNHFSVSFVVFGVTLAAFNLFHWSRPPSMLAEISPRISRHIASTEGTEVARPSRSEKILSYDCTNPQELKTLHSEVRIALLNCKTMTKTSNVFNTQNRFQATLFAEKDLLITDYIPLISNSNTIEVSEKANTSRKIVVYRTTHDAR